MRFIFNESYNTWKLNISDLRLWVHLGCSEQEKHHPQCVSFNVSITSSSNLKATYSDNLDDVFCYSKATKLIKKSISKKRYNLIERLACDVYDILWQILKDLEFTDSALSITVTKLSPPVRDIHGGVSFTYCGSGGNR
ncbi:MAG: dihydroneopterin aldolase [Pseudomonadota bacterium]